MKKLPGFGVYYQSYRTSSKYTIDRTSEMKGANIVLDKDARDWYNEFHFIREFPTGSTGLFKSEGEVDAFRHTYTSGMIIRTFGDKIGGMIIDVMNSSELRASKDREDPGSNFMDVYNNNNGTRIYKNLKTALGRTPTSEEFAEKVLEEVINGNVQIRIPNGKTGWQDRLQKELNDRRTERIINEWSEKLKRESRSIRGDALPPRDHDRLIDRYREPPSRRNFDRIDVRPGYGEGRRMYA